MSYEWNKKNKINGIISIIELNRCVKRHVQSTK